jgi:hypothetical protein
MRERPTVGIVHRSSCVSYKYNDLQTVCARYPKHAQSLFQTYNDMIYGEILVAHSTEEDHSFRCSSPAMGGR